MTLYRDGYHRMPATRPVLCGMVIPFLRADVPGRIRRRHIAVSSQ